MAQQALVFDSNVDRAKDKAAREILKDDYCHELVCDS